MGFHKGKKSPHNSRILLKNNGRAMGGIVVLFGGYRQDLDAVDYSADIHAKNTREIARPIANAKKKDSIKD